MRPAGLTLAVRDMRRSVKFYRDILGFQQCYGAETATFSTFDLDGFYLNLELSGTEVPLGWGRAIFAVDDVDALYDSLRSNGFHPTEPRNGSWGERYMHLRDPDGHELAFTHPITP